MNRLRRFAVLLLPAAFLVCAQQPVRAQAHRDALSAAEEEAVRESTDLPADRVKLYGKFLAERAGALNEWGKSPEKRGNPRKIHDTLEDYARIADEMSSNFDEYESYETNSRFPVPDLRKALQALDQQMNSWTAVLKGLPANPDYDFAKETALDANSSLRDSWKELVDHQTVWFRQKHEKDEQKLHQVIDPDKPK